MEQKDEEQVNLKKMIADYMEGGLLDNIIDMFKHDKNLYEYIGDLMKEERMRVRIGTTALVETLKVEDPENIQRALPHIIPLLKDKNPVTRGDGAYLLGIIGNIDSISFLQEILQDEDANVRLIAKEAIEDIESISRDF